MVYVVTGGAGFIGSHLVEALLAWGDRVVVLDDLSTGKHSNLPANAKVELVQGCVTDRQLVEKVMQRARGVFHLAAIASVEMSRLQWERTHQVNVTGMVNILAASARLAKPAPVVYASSAAVYGNNQQLPIDETEVPHPLTAYGADKLGCELHAHVASYVHSVPTMGMRLFNVYGPRQDASSPYSGVISIFSQRIAAAQDITLYGDGLQTRDFVYVGDVVRAFCAAMTQLEANREICDVVNVCTGKATSLLQLVEVLETITGHRVAKHMAEMRVGDIRASVGDANKLLRVLGFVAEKQLHEGLRLTLQSLVDECKQGVA
jgi:UDP-glucose 4-epimerase